MNRISRILWAVALIMVATTNWGCGVAAATQPTEFPLLIKIAAGNSLIYQTWERQPVVFEAGQAVELNFADGVFTVDGMIHKPHPIAPRHSFAVEELRNLYGNVPMIQEYLAQHQDGDETTRWNDAYYAWDTSTRQLVKDIEADFDSAASTGHSKLALAQRATEVLAGNALVESAELETRQRGSTSLLVIVRWKGIADVTRIPLPREDDAMESGQSPMSPAAARSLAHVLHWLEKRGNMLIELRFGTLATTSGQYRAEQEGR